MENTDDLRVRRIEALTPPVQILREFAITPEAKDLSPNRGTPSIASFMAPMTGSSSSSDPAPYTTSRPRKNTVRV